MLKIAEPEKPTYTYVPQPEHDTPEQNKALGIDPPNKVAPSSRSQEKAEVNKLAKRAGVRECGECKKRRQMEYLNQATGYNDDSGDLLCNSTTETGSIIGSSNKSTTYTRRHGHKITTQSVLLHTAICPECGRVYVTGTHHVCVTSGSASSISGVDLKA